MKKTTVKPTRIGRELAIKLIENSGGRFMTVVCNTKEKVGRKMNCVYKSTMKTGYARVKEIGKGFKAVNYQTLSELKLDKKLYKVS